MTIPFSDFIHKQVKRPTVKAMPFFHNVDSVTGVRILKSGTLTTKLCDVFKEPLIYLFYGRPAYKIDFNNGNMRGDSLCCPISIILKPNSHIKIKRIYPFDSGGFQKRYQSIIPKTIERDEFRLDHSTELVRKHIELFFKTNGNYFHGNSTFNQPITFTNTCIQTYVNIINTNGQTPFDDRVYTVEYQVDENIDLSKNILALAAPSKAFEDSEINEWVIKKWNAIPIAYSIYKYGNLLTYHGAMFEQIKSFLTSQNYIK